MSANEFVVFMYLLNVLTYNQTRHCFFFEASNVVFSVVVDIGVLMLLLLLLSSLLLVLLLLLLV